MAITALRQFLVVEHRNTHHQVLHQREVPLHRVVQHRTTVLQRTLRHHVRIPAQLVLRTAVHRVQRRHTAPRARQVTATHHHLLALHQHIVVQVRVAVSQREQALLLIVRVHLDQPLQAKDLDTA